MENVKRITVTDIKWDAPKSADLPDRIDIILSEETEYLLDDIEGYADNLCDFLSDIYEYCMAGFNVECK